MNKITRILIVAALAMVSGAQIANAQNKACGWYAITDCKPTYEEAAAYAQSTGSGFVINTSSPAFPNFASGYFCVVNGPLDRSTAIDTANYWQSTGASPGAYAKNAC